MTEENNEIVVRVKKDKENEDKAPSREEFASQAEFESNMRKFAKAMRQEAREEKEAEDTEVEKKLKEAENESYDVLMKSKESGKGTLPASLNYQNSAKPDKSFASRSELISYLKDKIRQGDAQAKEQYKQLVAKAVKGLKQKNITWEDSKDPSEPSFIQHVLNERNKKFRNSKSNKENE